MFLSKKDVSISRKNSFFLGILALIFSGTVFGQEEIYRVDGCTKKNRDGNGISQSLGMISLTRSAASSCCYQKDLTTGNFSIDIKRSSDIECERRHTGNFSYYYCACKKIHFDWVECRRKK